MGHIHEGMAMDILENPIVLDLKLDDLRMIVNCFRAVSYMMELDNEPYLDTQALALKAKLEGLYSEFLRGRQEDVEAPASLRASV